MATTSRLLLLSLSVSLLWVSTVHGQQHDRIGFYFDRGCTGANLALTEGTYSLPGGVDMVLMFADFPQFAADMHMHSPDNRVQLSLDVCGTARMSMCLSPASMPDARLSITCMYANECQDIKTGFVHMVLDGKVVQSMIWLPAGTAADSLASSPLPDDTATGSWFWQ